MNILVTGATGTLGRAVVPVLLDAGHTVRAISRKQRAGGGAQWVRADLATGEGLGDAVAGIDTVVHLASAPYRGRYTYRVDVEGTRRLRRAAERAGVRHLLFISIVGVDQIPWGYFRRKVAAENLVQEGDLDWSILRLTQFHPFIDTALQGAGRLPVLLTDTGVSAQPVDPGDAAERILAQVEAGPSGLVEEFGGPEVLSGDDLVRQWQRATGRRGAVRSIRVPGRLGQAFRAGDLTTTATPTGRVTLGEYLAARYAPGGPEEQNQRAKRGARLERKRRAVIWFERHVQNPPVKAAIQAGVPLSMFALLEVTGRRTGQPRQIPIINGLHGDTFWIVAEHGRRANYVRNLEADPNVRLRIGEVWRSGTAHILDDDDPIARASWMAKMLGPMHKADVLAVRLLGTTPLTIRVDLEPEAR